MKRRSFVKKLGLSTAAATVGSIIQAPNIHASKRIRWRMVTT